MGNCPEGKKKKFASWKKNHSLEGSKAFGKLCFPEWFRQGEVEVGGGQFKNGT